MHVPGERWPRVVARRGDLLNQPKPLGMLLALAGASYRINSLALFLPPKLTAVLFRAILMPVWMGELCLALDLRVNGVNMPQWWRPTGSTNGNNLG